MVASASGGELTVCVVVTASIGLNPGVTDWSSLRFVQMKVHSVGEGGARFSTLQFPDLECLYYACHPKSNHRRCAGRMIVWSLVTIWSVFVKVVKLLTLFVFLCVGALYAAYSILAPVYLPYIEGGEMKYSSLYGHFDVEEVHLSLSTFSDQESWWQPYLSSDKPFTRQLSAMIAVAESVTVVANMSFREYGVLALEITSDGSFRCLMAPYKNMDGVKVLAEGMNPFKYYSGTLIEQCNLQGHFPSARRASFIDFVYHDIARCFGLCSRESGVVFQDEVRESQIQGIQQAVIGFLSDEHGRRDAPFVEISSKTITIKSLLKTDRSFLVEYQLQNSFYGTVELNAVVQRENGDFKVIADGVINELAGYIDPSMWTE